LRPLTRHTNIACPPPLPPPIDSLSTLWTACGANTPEAVGFREVGSGKPGSLPHNFRLPSSTRRNGLFVERTLSLSRRDSSRRFSRMTCHAPERGGGPRFHVAPTHFRGELPGAGWYDKDSVPICPKSPTTIVPSS
jgi:hypothetical protein